MKEFLEKIQSFFREKKTRTILSLFVLVPTILFVLLLVSGYIVWLTEKSRVSAQLDKFYEEVTNPYDQFKSNPIIILDVKGKKIGEFTRRNYRPIRADNLKEHQNLLWAILSSEDREFYNHGGVNFKAIFRAVFVNLINLRISQGGSTLTQQLAKLTLRLGGRNILNKIVELFCTYYIESKFEDKDTILSIYLNRVYLGEGNEGLEEASRYYFQKSAKELTTEEAAMIVGIIPAPSVYNPVRNLGLALERQKIVLNSMSENMELHPSPKKISRLFKEKIPMRIQNFKEAYSIKESKGEGDKKVFSSEIGRYGYDKNFRVNLAPDFNTEIRNFLYQTFSDEELEQKELVVYSTLDYEKQLAAESSLQAGILKIKSEIAKLKSTKNIANNPKKIEILEDISDRITGSMVSINPFNNEVQVLVGGERISKVYKPNRAEDIQRQPGSTIKALVYAIAFQERIVHPFSIIKDEKLNLKGYSPKNWYAGYRGNITVRAALAQSVNTVAVKLLDEIGIEKFRSILAKILNLTDEEKNKRFPKNLSLALGSGELSPRELNLVYGTLLNGGKKIIPKKILKIVDMSQKDLSTNQGEVIWSEEEYVPTEQILDPVACAMAILSLEAVLTEEGTMQVKRKKDDSVSIAGKTGTVQFPNSIRKKWLSLPGVRDAWFVGLVPNQVTTVWLGNDEGAPFPGSGAGSAGPVWIEYFRKTKASIPLSANLIPNLSGDYELLDICVDTLSVWNGNEDCKKVASGQVFYKGFAPERQAQKTEQFEDKIPGFGEGTIPDSNDEVEGSTTVPQVPETPPTPDSSKNSPEGTKETPKENPQ